MNEVITWAMNNITRPTLNCTVSALSYRHYHISWYLTLCCALLLVARTTSMVSTATAAICLWVYRLFAINHPIIIVTNVPPDRHIIYIGILTAYPRDKLFKVFERKKSVTITPHRWIGICRGFRKYLADIEKLTWRGNSDTATDINWKNVTNSPTD